MKSNYYICEVARTYDDGKYAKQDEFEKLYKAKIWLDTTFNDELAKHFERIGDAANKLKQ